MTRTGLSPALGAHMPLPFVAVNPDDAVHAGLVDGGFARVTTAHGAGVLSVRVDAGQQRGSLFAPIHWSGATASSARIGALVAPDNDPHSGQPEAKATPASIAPVAFASRGFALSRAPLALPADTWWARVAVDNGHGLLFAADLPLDGWRDYASGAFANLEMAEYLDAPRGVYRVAAFAHGRLDACLYVAPAAQAPAWDAVRRLFELDEIEGAQRRILLSGRAGEGLPDMGPLICACFGVGLNVIRAAIASGQASDTETIGKALRAGTNCGSCLPELKRIVHDHATHAA
jgi:assimilatory nitrate reductase catalytic subunit